MSSTLGRTGSAAVTHSTALFTVYRREPMTKKPDEERILWMGERKPPHSDLWWAISMFLSVCLLVVLVATCWAITNTPP